MRGWLDSKAGRAALFLVVLAVSCGGPTRETRIRRFLGQTAALAEKNDYAGLMGRIASDFRDFEGRDKAETGALIQGHLVGRRGIVIHVLSVRAGETGSDGQNPVQAEILLSSGPAEALRRLLRYAGETYRLDLVLGPSGKGSWEIRYAAWEEVPVSGLFPESVKVLKELFPGLGGNF